MTATGGPHRQAAGRPEIKSVVFDDCAERHLYRAEREKHVRFVISTTANS
jgi:hypothetical protein